jgi:hypothetical protein
MAAALVANMANILNMAIMTGLRMDWVNEDDIQWHIGSMMEPANIEAVAEAAEAARGKDPGARNQSPPLLAGAM